MSKGQTCYTGNMSNIKKVALAVFKDKQLLQVRTHKQKDVFYTLGGKPEKGESDEDALIREVKEEIGCDLIRSSIEFLAEFKDVAHGKDAILKVRMYTGRLIGIPKATSEVVEIGYFDSHSPKRHLSTIAQRTIFPWLKEQGYIN